VYLSVPQTRRWPNNLAGIVPGMLSGSVYSWCRFTGFCLGWCRRSHWWL